MTSNLNQKDEALRLRLAALGTTLVAYSGGTDSAFLAWAAHRILGPRMLAVLADSPSLPRQELKSAVSFAEEMQIPLKIVTTEEMARPEYVRNDAARCFHCKDELFRVMEKQRSALGFRHIAYGMNANDRGDFRPGQQAAQLHNVVAPLAEVELTKDEIRQLARRAGLQLWDKPASACLSSRIEYGHSVTREALSVVEAGEMALRELGFRQFRVRHHGKLVRIEIASEELGLAFNPEMAQRFVPIFKKLGFEYVTLDGQGYRSGSMNAVLPIDAIGRAS